MHIRRYLKNFKGTKWSVTSNYYDINVSLTEATFIPFKQMENLDTKSIERKCSINTSLLDWYRKNKKYYPINNYGIEEDLMLTDESKELFKKVKDFVNSYNFDDSDAMTDYFDFNFHLNLSIGKWDKSFKSIEDTNKKKLEEKTNENI